MYTAGKNQLSGEAGESRQGIMLAAVVVMIAITVSI